MTFITDDFLLHNEMARELYHTYASDLPIIDYHNHLPPADIAHNRQFENLTQAWLEGDHYKWRAMRTHGIPETFCTGQAPDREKFRKWAATVPYTLRNPLYHWTHLELLRYFNIPTLLNEASADNIYETASAMLGTNEGRVHGLLLSKKVETLCSTDDPADDLNYHRIIRENNPGFNVYPTFRPDKAMKFGDVKAYNHYLDQLGAAAGLEIKNLDDLYQALDQRQAYFSQHGCRLSDHGLDKFYAETYSPSEVASAFLDLRNGKNISQETAAKLASDILFHLGQMNHKRNWTQQFHVGAIRNNNTRKYLEMGPDTGWDSIGDPLMARDMSRLLDRLDQQNQLTRTILYNNNPRDNAVFATMPGNFNDGEIPNKVQWGSAWWFLDQKDGMRDQLNMLSNTGLLSRFIGMLTDSRSFLSFPRHEYFRRILCNLIGEDVDRGELPKDSILLGNMVRAICYENAKNFFGFEQ
ncbi:MAG: glucuronate isomerase [Cyclobacteriaceae bacterium]|nr:glucuronate isomerase [Cyclobacteriaceae bacterium]